MAGKLVGGIREAAPDAKICYEEEEVVGPDGVHLSVNANRFAAVSLCYRLAEKEVMISGGGVSAKKRQVS